VTDTVCPPTVTVVVRAFTAVFGVAERVTDPLPDPGPPATVSHAALLVALQAQPAGAVIVTLVVFPLAVIFTVEGDAAYPHAAACVTVTFCPPTLIVALREVSAELAAAVMVTLPLPEPVPPLVIPSHVALVVAVHPHPGFVITYSRTVPPAAGMLALSCDTP
jgi:hypothetical protein